MVFNNTMHQRGQSFFRALLVLLIAAVAAVFLIQYLKTSPAPSPATTTTAPATQVLATQESPATEPTRQLVDLLDLIRADNPNYPTTQPLDLPADLSDAARLVFDRPIYLDLAGRLWITHKEGKSIEELLQKPIKTRTLIVNEMIRYVHYDDDGQIAVVATKPDAIQSTVTIYQPRVSPQQMSIEDANWDRAVRFGTSAILPTSKGYIELNLASKNAKSLLPPVTLKFESEKHSPVILQRANDSLLCWSPWDNDVPGSTGAIVRTPKNTYVLDGSTGWFDRIIQLIPLTDGTILAVGKTEDGIELKLSSLEASSTQNAQANEKIESIARKLADRDPAVREKTQRELEAIGPSVYPILEQMRENMPAEAQVRIENMLGQRFAPMIAGLTPLPGEVKTASRFRDGGCVLLLTGGGAYREGIEDKTLIPAWISIRMDHYLERLPDALTNGFAVGQYQFQAVGSETLVIDPILGAKRWIGSKFITLFTKDLRHFDQFIGIDGNQRWIFRSSSQPEKTLVIDSSLPDPTPRLPIWMIEAPDGAGWTSTGWPAVMKDKKRTFVLGERGWRMIDEKTEQFQTTPPNLLPTVATDANGNRLEISGKMIAGTYNKKSVLLHLPEKAADIRAIFLSDGKLFLHGNSVVHRAPMNEDQLNGELVIDGSFTKNIPSTPKRIWQDPAGRIVFADSTTLWVAFPLGRIPSDIKTLIVKPITEDEEK